MSRFIALEAISIFLQSIGLPIIAAEFLNSRHVSSNLTMVLTRVVKMGGPVRFRPVRTGFVLHRVGLIWPNKNIDSKNRAQARPRTAIGLLGRPVLF
jgi:hypothetical protein